MGSQRDRSSGRVRQDMIPKTAPRLSYKLCAVTLIFLTALIFETQTWCLIVCTATALVNRTEKKRREEGGSPHLLVGS